jgi:hypothetical protein
MPAPFLCTERSSFNRTKGEHQGTAAADRLSRNVAFIATLMDSGVEFIAVDNPHPNKLTIHILHQGRPAGRESAR